MTETELIKQEIETTKAGISAKVETLQSQARELASPIHYVEEYPYLSMGLALGAGLVVGANLEQSKKMLQPVAMGILSLLLSEFEKKYVSSASTSDALT